MRDILALVKPTPEARYAVFYSLADGADGGHYYDVHKIENMRGDPLRDRRLIGRRDFPARRRRNNMIVAHPLRMNRMEALNAE